MGENLPTLSKQEDAFGLSSREGQILEFATQGMTDQAIANQLGISLATVGTYWGRVRIKLGPFNRTELVAKFLKHKAEYIIQKLRYENHLLLERIAEHAEVEDMLRASLEMFRGLLETAPDAILVVDGEGKVQFANDQASVLFGYSVEELSALNVDELVPDRYRPMHMSHRDQYGENPVKRQMGEHLATMALRKDGSEFPMATALSATKTASGLIITCIIRDLSLPLPNPLK